MSRSDRNDLVKFIVCALYIVSGIILANCEDLMSKSVYEALHFLYTIIIPLGFILFYVVYASIYLYRYWLSDKISKLPRRHLPDKIAKLYLRNFSNLSTTLLFKTVHIRPFQIDFSLLNKVEIEYCVFLHQITSYMLSRSPITPSVDTEEMHSCIYEETANAILNDYILHLDDQKANGQSVHFDPDGFLDTLIAYYKIPATSQIPPLHFVSARLPDQSFGDIAIYNHYFNMFVNHLIYFASTDQVIISNDPHSCVPLLKRTIAEIYLPIIAEHTSKYLYQAEKLLRLRHYYS